MQLSGSMIKKILSLILSFTLLVFGASRDNFPFSRTVKSPFLIALGYANLGAYNNESSLEINPAGLAKLEYDGVSIGGRNWIANMYMVNGTFFISLPTDLELGLAAGLDYINVGEEGVSSYDASGEKLNPLQLRSLIFNLGAGLGLPLGLSAGISASIFNQKQGSKAESFGGAIMTLGLLYTLDIGEHKLNLGGNFKNTFTKSYSGVYMLGGTFEFKKGLSLMIAVEPSSAGYFMLDFGSSYKIERENIMIKPKVSWRQGIALAKGGGINGGG